MLFSSVFFEIPGEFRDEYKSILLMRDTHKYKRIIEGIQNNDANAWAMLYDQVGKFKGIEKYIKNNSGNQEDAFSVYHDALHVFEKRVKSGDFKGESTRNITNFIFTTAKYIWLKTLREKKNNLGNELNMDLSVQPVEMDEGGSPMIEMVLKCLEHLGKSCKNTLIDFYYGGLSYEEIMNKYNYGSLKTVRNTKSRCLVQLRDLVNSKLK